MSENQNPLPPYIKKEIGKAVKDMDSFTKMQETFW